jgi:hypothetical protein
MARLDPHLSRAYSTVQQLNGPVVGVVEPEPGGLVVDYSSALTIGPHTPVTLLKDYQCKKHIYR